MLTQIEAKYFDHCGVDCCPPAPGTSHSEVRLLALATYSLALLFLEESLIPVPEGFIAKPNLVMTLCHH